MNLVTFLDNLSINIYGMKRSEALEQGVCLCCKNPPEPATATEKFEYEHSALCEKCFYKEIEHTDVML